MDSILSVYNKLISLQFHYNLKIILYQTSSERAAPSRIRMHCTPIRTSGIRALFLTDRNTALSCHKLHLRFAQHRDGRVSVLVPAGDAE
jgi:hypothetical protein